MAAASDSSFSAKTQRSAVDSVSAAVIKKQRKWLKGTASGRDWADTVTHRAEVKCTSTLHAPV